MKVEQKEWTESSGWNVISDNSLSESADLVLVFGSRSLLSNHQYYQDVKEFYKNSNIIMASTAGEIMNTKVSDNTLVLTAMKFDSTALKVKNFHISKSDNSYEAGVEISKELDAEDLSHIFILSDGQQVNGSDLVQGLNKNLLEGKSGP